MRHSTLLLALALTACNWKAPADDAGEEAWVMQAIPTVLGRQPTSMAEVEVLASIARQESRHAVLDILFSDEAYIQYWTQVLLEDLQLDQGGTRATNEACWRPDSTWTTAQVDRHTNGLTRAEADALLAVFDGTSAQGIATGAPADGVPLSEFVEAAVRTNRLDLAFVPSMPVVGTSFQVPTTQAEEDSAREHLRNRFLARYLDRDLDCMACHNNGWSATGPTSGWDRHHNVGELDLDATVFSYLDGSTEVDGRFGSEGHKINPLFRTDVLSTAGSHRPWGLLDACVTHHDASGTPYQITSGAPLTTSGSLAFAGFSHLGATPHDLDILDLSESFRIGIRTVEDHVRSPQPVAAATAIGTSFCEGCHDGTNQFHVSVFAEVPDSVLVAALMDDTNGMVYPNTQDVGVAESWVSDLRTFVPYAGQDRLDDPDHGLAFLLANKIANHLFDELAGQPFTVLHRQPRNVDQANLIQEIAAQFVVYDFSLQDALRWILVSEAFNRRDVATSTMSDAYDLPFIFAPFAELSYSAFTQLPAADQHRHEGNSIGDAVHIGSPIWRIQKVHHALGWPSRWHSDGVAYPSDALMAALGEYVSDLSPGFDDTHVGASLSWEDTFSHCALPAGVSSDWVTSLDTHATAQGLTNEQTARLLKERLISDPDLETVVYPGAAQSEWDALDGLFGDLTLTYTSANEPLLRAYCGALLASPQFQLVGMVAPRDAAAAAAVEVDPSFPLRVGGMSSRLFCDNLGRAWNTVTRECEIPTSIEPDRLTAVR